MESFKSNIKQEVTLRLFKSPMETIPFLEQDMASLVIVTRNESISWMLEFFPDFSTEPLWDELVKENQFDDMNYYVEVFRKGHRATGLVSLKGSSNNPCKLQGIDSLSKWKKVI